MNTYLINGKRITCDLAVTEAQRDEVYRLRYACYRRDGSIPEREDGRFSDDYDQLANHFSFLVRDGEDTLATVRISVVRPELGWDRAPSCKVFGDHPAFQRIAGESFVEASRLCFGSQARRDVLFRLVANMAALAEVYEAEWMVACPRMEHSPIYQRVFGFQRLAAARRYFGVSFETEMLGLRREELRRTAAQIKPMREAWDSAAADARRVKAAAADPRCILLPKPGLHTLEEESWRHHRKATTSRPFCTDSALATVLPSQASSMRSTTN